jgi:formylmethanofuran dehydrogenase subunit D
METAVTIVTFRDIFQNEEEKKNRYSEDYRRLSAQIILDKQDMANLGLKDGQSVLVENAVGQIIVAAKTSEDDSHPGLAFMVKSPWSNQLIEEDVCETGSQEQKKTSAHLSPSSEAVTQISELFQRIKN